MEATRGWAFYLRVDGEFDIVGARKTRAGAEGAIQKKLGRNFYGSFDRGTNSDGARVYEYVTNGQVMARVVEGWWTPGDRNLFGGVLTDRIA